MAGPNISYKKNTDDQIFDEWLPLAEWNSSQQDATIVIKISKRLQIDWLVLDDYRVDEVYQLQIRGADIRWLQFDGSARKPLWADVVINANPGARPEDYQAVLRNLHTRLLLGPSYAILRPEFYNTIPRDRSLPVQKILLSFGGGDDRGANYFVLSTLLPVASLSQQFIVISGASNPNNPSLKRWVDNYGQGRVQLYIDPEHVAPLFSSCQLAIIAGGTTTYEAALSGLPMMIMSIADNQIAQSTAWSDCGCAIYLGDIKDVSKVNLIVAFKQIIALKKYKTMANSLVEFTSRSNSLLSLTDLLTCMTSPPLPSG